MKIKEQEIKSWIKDRIKQKEIDKYTEDGKDFIDDNKIQEKLKKNLNADVKKVEDILSKSLEIETLSLDETATLLNVKDFELLEKMKNTALKIKKKVYDNRIVTFAPLYMCNYCVNDCLYCGFRKSNTKATRRILSLEEVKEESKVLAGDIGHKRLIVVYGEYPLTDVNYMKDTIQVIYDTKVKIKNGFGQIRRVNVNAPPLSIEELKILHDVGIGTFQVFQETYHHDTYKKLHPQGTIKGNYKWRLYGMHRAMEAGVDDVGLGALFGLYNWKFEVMGLVAHSRELEDKFGIGAHTISFPRLEPAYNSPYTQNSKYKVSDEDFMKLVTVIRLSVPYTGMIITAREPEDIRRKSLSLGITQTDASTRIGIGAYSEKVNRQESEKQQFLLGDTRSLDEVIKEFADMGYITSFCTAGYRCGRTGKCIMDLLKSGQEGNYCKLNAVLTFREWIDDFASQETLKSAEKIINKEIKEIKQQMPKVYPKFIDYYNKIKNGERDLYF